MLWRAKVRFNSRMAQETRGPNAPIPTGEFAEPDFVRLPEPAAFFGKRAARLRTLSADHALAPYLTFLADLVTIQQQLAATQSPPERLPPAAVEAEQKLRRLVCRLRLSAPDAAVWLGMLRKLVRRLHGREERKGE